MTGALHIVLAMKPVKGSFLDNARKHGVGGLNIDGGRIATSGEVLRAGAGGLLSNVRDQKDYPDRNGFEQADGGRWPANVVLDVAMATAMDKQSGDRPVGNWCRQKDSAHPFGGAKGAEYDEWKKVKDSGGASRYFRIIRGG